MDEALTAEQAAKILGVSKATVTRLRQNGSLPYIRLSSRYRYPRLAVEELEVERRQGLTVSDLKSKVAAQTYEINKLKQQMALVIFKLQMTDLSIDLANDDLMEFYHQNKSMPTHLTTQYVGRWMQLASNIGEREFERITALCGDPYPWREFYNHADELIAKLRRKKKFRTNPELQHMAQAVAMTQQDIRKRGMAILLAKPANMSVGRRFDIIVTGDGERRPVDPEELCGGLQLPGTAEESDMKKLSRLSEGSPAGRANLRGGRR
jgi:excisionase family DNA binding protein